MKVTNTKEELAYLAGLFEGTTGLRSLGTVGAEAISKTAAWPQYMAKTYGGSAREFTTPKGKTYWGWFVPLALRLELLNRLEQTKALKAFEQFECDVLREKFEKALSKLEGE